MGGDIVVFRQGRGFSVLFNFGIEASLLGSNRADSGLTESLARKALEKLRPFA